MIAIFVMVSVRKQAHQIDQNFMAKRLLCINSFFSFSPAEESEAASKQILAKSEQIRKFQEENKYLGQLVSLVIFSFFSFNVFYEFEENKVIKSLQSNGCPLSQM